MTWAPGPEMDFPPEAHGIPISSDFSSWAGMVSFYTYLQEETVMPVVESLIRSEADGTISFGNYKLPAKSKLQDFEHDGDSYKIKTFYEITKLERNGMFVYESVPGTTVEHFSVVGDGVEFVVEGDKDAQITIQLEEDTEYEVFVDDVAVGGMRTNRSGKLMASVELNEGTGSRVKVVKR